MQKEITDDMEYLSYSLELAYDTVDLYNNGEHNLITQSMIYSNVLDMEEMMKNFEDNLAFGEAYYDAEEGKVGNKFATDESDKGTNTTPLTSIMIIGVLIIVGVILYMIKKKRSKR